MKMNENPCWLEEQLQIVERMMSDAIARGDQETATDLYTEVEILRERVDAAWGKED